MSKKHQYQAIITWTGNSGTGTSSYTGYQRSHEISIENKVVIEASSDKAFRGDGTRHNPEDLFLSSIASCHMLWYLHLCADHNIIVDAYTDRAAGTMETTEDGSGKFVNITLHPEVTVTEEHMAELAVSLHHKAHEMCFLANSVNFEILVAPLIKIK